MKKRAQQVMAESDTDASKTMRLDGFMTTKKFRGLVDQFPDNELYRFSLGKALFDAGQYAESMEHLYAALERKPDWTAVCILLGRAASMLNYPDHARAYFKRGLELAVDQDSEELRAEIMRHMKALG